MAGSKGRELGYGRANRIEQPHIKSLEATLSPPPMAFNGGCKPVVRSHLRFLVPVRLQTGAYDEQSPVRVSALANGLIGRFVRSKNSSLNQPISEDYSSADTLVLVRSVQEPPGAWWPHVICSGTVLRTLLGLPTLFPTSNPNRTANYYLQENGSKFVACTLDGAIYFAHKNSGPGDSNEDGLILRRRKLEHLVTTRSDGTPWGELQGGTVDAFFTVLERTIGSTRIVYSHKVDCEDPAADNVPAPDRYVKLRFRKAAATGSSSSQCWKESNNSKLNWIETFVQGASKVVAGHAIGDTLHRCELLTASDLPEQSQCPNAKDHYFHWSKEQNINFLSTLFDLLRSLVQYEHTSAVYELAFDCTNNDVLHLRVTEWPSDSQEFVPNNIILNWGAAS